MSTTEAIANLAANLEERGLRSADRLLELALLADVPARHLTEWLNGRLVPCPRELQRVAVILRTTPAVLFAEPEPSRVYELVQDGEAPA